MAYNVSPFADQTGRGGLILVQTTQAGGQAISQQDIPIMGASINNPRNVSYAWQGNAAVGVINAVLGRRSPSFSFTALAKPTWFKQALLSDLIGGTDSFISGTTYITSEYACRVGQPVTYPRLGVGYRDVLGMKCVGMEMVHTATSGLMVTMQFLALCSYTEDAYYHSLYGDPNPAAVFTDISPAAFVSDPGLDYGPSDITYGSVSVGGNIVTAFTPFSGSTADQVDGFTLSLVRAQAQQMYDNGTIWPEAVTSASVGGSLRILQGATFGNPPTGFAVRIGPAGGNGVIIAPVMSLDSLNQPFGQGRSVMTSDQSLVDLTGGVFSNGYPFYICASF